MVLEIPYANHTCIPKDFCAANVPCLWLHRSSGVEHRPEPSFPGSHVIPLLGVPSFCFKEKRHVLEIISQFFFLKAPSARGIV